MLLGCLSLAWGCSSEPKLAENTSVSRTPLQPLIYTELPDLTAAAAAVRERRLLRELLHGTEKGKEWGRLQSRENLPAPTNEQELGELLAQALIERDEARWDHAFVSPASYAGMVRVDLEDARKFVDELQGSSMPTWRMFLVIGAWSELFFWPRPLRERSGRGAVMHLGRTLALYSRALSRAFASGLPARSSRRACHHA